MINIRDKKKCCGCSACYSICPQKCIDMISDEEGFKYPKVDIKKCIDCHLCEKTCPILNKEEPAFKINKALIGRDNRKDIIRRSTSGGIFTSLMEYALENNGVIYGVICDENNVIRHARIMNKEDNNFNKVPGSKYVQSEITGVFQMVRDDLINNKFVLFSGTPCQVAGLKKYLQKDYANLFSVDVVCHGTPSPLLWKKYVYHQESKYKSKIVGVHFRNKTYGYHSGSMKLIFDNGKVYYGSARVDLFLKAFFSDLCSRPSCYACPFKSIHHVSDLTLFDCWSPEKLNDKIIDDDKGFTNIIVQSSRGNEMLDSLKEKLTIYSSDINMAVQYDGIMINNSVEWNKKREIFFHNLQDQELSMHCKNFLKISILDKIIEKSKNIYYWKKKNENR